MKFLWSTISVRSMEESLSFYNEVVGLPINRRIQAGPATEIAFLGEGETQIELVCDGGHEVPGNVEGISLGFQVKSVDEMMAFVEEKGIKVKGGPVQPNPHVRFFFVKDPNGITIQFVENM